MSKINLDEDRKRRMAGDAFSKDYKAPSKEFIEQKREVRKRDDNEAFRKGFRDKVEMERGTEWYDKALKQGLDHATSDGAYTGGEVRAEMRYGRNGKTVDEMRDYFQGLINDGVKFNGNARDFLADKHGLNFPGSGDESPTPQPTPEPTPTPTPTPSPETPTYTPPKADQIIELPGFVSGGQTQNVNQDNDIISNVTGDNNTVTNTQNNSVNQYGAYGTASRAKMLRDRYVADVSRFVRA